MPGPTTFNGWLVSGKGEPMEWKEMNLRAEDDYSVDMDISHCGICGSDIHTMDAYVAFLIVIKHFTDRLKIVIGELPSILFVLDMSLPVFVQL